MKLNISKVFQDGNKGFKSWWIPLCAVSAILLFNNSFLPNIIASHFEEISLFKDAWNIIDTNLEQLKEGNSVHYAIENCRNQLIYFSQQEDNIFKAYALFYKFMGVLAFVSLIALILQIATLILAKASITEKKDLTIKRDFLRIIILSFSYSTISLIKGFAFVCFILPGIYLYVKLYFTGFLILEESANPFSAMKKSWKMTEGNFWEITSIFFITVIINIISGMTIIGFIPGNSYNYTLRAAAYKQLK